ncbi:MAG TPA: malto-oligosyltrehalose trehalohydrolase [Solirubrobacteraceae bacterium]
MLLPWRHPLGATPRPDGTAEFRVWAPRARRVAVRVRDRDHELADAGLGVREGVVEAAAGDDYVYVLDGTALPDPCSRHQPEGLRGPSRVVEPAAFTIAELPVRPAPADLVIYELHVGTFSAEGTFDGAIPRLGALAELGVTAIEVMPIAEFPGRHGWGYDGVYPSAAHSAYGGPAGFARLVDAAHAAGLAVILDVVYNHVGASGNKALRAFGPYFTDKYTTVWGDAINYDDEWADPVREWVLQSAEGWVRDYKVDGLRLDAIHAIYDTSARHVLRELTDRVDALIVAESGLNDPKVIRPDGLGCDAVWADDFHHALRVLLTGERDGYYEEFGTVAQLARAFHRPVLHTGQWSSYRKRSFGAPHDDRRPEQFVVFAQNHDQVGNRAFGDRLPPPVRPLAAFCTLLTPFVPMLFMGEEHGEAAPFQFFSDHIDAEIATATREGRRREFAAFAQFAGEEVPDPQDPATYERSKLTWQEDRALRELYARLLRVRREVRGEARADFDEDERWLRVRRGDHELVCNFAGAPRTVAVTCSSIVLATHDGAELRDGSVTLPPLAGALLQ